MKLKSYTKAELALLYSPENCPQAAARKLRRWILHCKPLLAELTAVGYDSASKRYSSKQVNVIFKYLGEP